MGHRNNLVFGGVSDLSPPDQAQRVQKTDILAAKYSARGFDMHLGMDVGVSIGGLESTAAPWSYPTINSYSYFVQHEKELLKA